MIEIPKMMQLVEDLRSEYRIRVSHGVTALYDLDLNGCFDYLKIVCPTLPPAYSFRTFIATQPSRIDEWRGCINDSLEKLRHPLAVLTVWNTMPSRVTYALVNKATGKESPLDPESIAGNRVLLAAAQLSRIISRKLELTAFGQLQNDLNSNTAVTVDILVHLAHLLLSLRWRVSWWVLFGSSVTSDHSEGKAQKQQGLEATITRVQNLCRILYFYYCSMRRRLPAFSGSDRLEGKSTRYADTQNAVYETFPEDESVSGFENWLREGQEKIRAARVVEQLKVVGLSQ